VTARELDRRWHDAEPTLLVDRRHPDGRPFLSVAFDATLGYRVSAPGHGTHLVSPRGDSIASSVRDRPHRRWQRLFFAQVLPLAATAAGLDVLHAGAVESNGHAVALVGCSGVGKSSVVAHLVAGGAAFFTDDVLAIEACGTGLEAHPGAAAASLAFEELSSMSAYERARVARTTWGRDDGKVQLDVGSLGSPAQLSAVFFLRRTPGGETPSVEQSDSAAALLGAAFLPYVRTPSRMAMHLAVAAAVGGSGRTYTVTIPPSTSARAAAAHIRDFCRAEGLWR
jgi:hypothetical protein